MASANNRQMSPMSSSLDFCPPLYKMLGAENTHHHLSHPPLPHRPSAFPPRLHNKPARASCKGPTLRHSKLVLETRSPAVKSVYRVDLEGTSSSVRRWGFGGGGQINRNLDLDLDLSLAWPVIYLPTVQCSAVQYEAGHTHPASLAVMRLCVVLLLS